MTSSIDPTKPTTGTASTASVRANFAAAANEITALQALTATQTASIAAISGVPGYRELIQQVTANSPAVTFVTGLTDTNYDSLALEFVDIACASNVIGLRILTATAGGAYITAYNGNWAWFANGAAGGGTAYSPATYIALSLALDANAASRYHGYVTIPAHRSTTALKGLYGTGGEQNVTGNQGALLVGGWVTPGTSGGTGAITGIQIIGSAGGTITGTVRAYRIRSA